MNRSEQNAGLLEKIANNSNATIADAQGYLLSILIDISKSMAQIADALTDKEEPSNGTMAQWVHSEAHKVCCSNCGAQVSMRAAYDMNYCFKCGRKMVSSEKTQEV